MRPLPVVALLVALAVVLVVGLLIQIDSGEGEAARDAALSAAREPESSQASPQAALDATDAAVGEESRAASGAPLAPAAGPPRSRPEKGGEPVVLTGRVLGDLGRPVEGAKVYAAELDGLAGIRDVPLDEIDSSAGPERSSPDSFSTVRRAEATTDREGRFRITPRSKGAGTEVAVAVRARGFAPFDREFSLSGTGKDLGDLSLDASVLLSGRVLDPNGRPVPGARIARLSSSSASISVFLGRGGQRGAEVARTDAQGAFRVKELAAGPWRLLVTHEDHPDHVETGETERPGDVQSGLVITLAEGMQIQGRVVGAPAAVAPTLFVRGVPQPSPSESPSESSLETTGERPGTGGVSAVDPSASTPIVPGRSFARTAQCQADGTFTLRGLRAGETYRITARESGRDSFFARARSAPVSARAGERGVELPYRPETALVFQVVDAATLAPVVDLAVQAGYGFAMPLLDDDGRPVRRFPEGRVRFGNLPARPANPDAVSGASLNLRVEAAGYEVFERSDVVLLEGQDTDLGVVRLERAPVVSVLVQDDASGTPVAGATVTLSEVRPEPAFQGRRISISTDEEGGDDFFSPGAAHRGKTGADGRVSVSSLPGKTALIEVRHAGHARYESEPIALPLSESVERTVRLGVGGSVTVEVADNHARPVPGAEVDHQGPENDPGEIVFTGTDGRTDAAGLLVFEHLQAGVHRFRLRGQGGPGFVDTGGGRAFVRRTTSRGGLEEESWTAVEVGEGSAETVRLVAPARGSLAGRITESGKPLADATVRLAPRPTRGDERIRLPGILGGDGGREARTDGRGEYLLDGVEEGEYLLEVDHPSRAMTHEADARVREGENEMDLDLPVAIVEGTVTGVDDKPVAGARVRAERALAPGTRRPVALSVMMMADGDAEPEVTVGSPLAGAAPAYTDANGRYSLRGVLSDVELQVEADAKDAQPARSASFRVGADDTKRGVDLKLERGGVIEVSVRRGGKPASGGFLARAQPLGSGGQGEGPPKIGVIGPSGTTRITGLKPGKWRVSLDSLAGRLGDGGEDAVNERAVEVRAGETAQASFELP